MCCNDVGSVHEFRANIWQHEPVLVDHWSRGMIGVMTEEQKSLAHSCAAVTGLTFKQIKVILFAKLNSFLYFLGSETEMQVWGCE